MSYYLTTNTPSFGLSPFRRFDSVIDRLIDDAFGNAFYSTSRHFDLDENDSQYSLTLELPGFKQSDVEVNLDKEVLSVTAKRGERTYHQSVTLPRGVDADKIEARLEHGLLQITLPKSEIAKPRKISIK
jgi:HSP20 family protein